MTDLCIQIQPGRAPGLDVDGLCSLCEALAHDTALIRRFAVVRGNPGEDYINLMFASDRPRELWSVLQRQLYGSPAFGGPMQASSMAMCEGERGWDDYLLLQHFNPKVPRDAFPSG